MSAPAQTETQPAAPAKKGKAPKPPKPPKVKKPRQPWGIAPWLLLFGVLLAGAAAAVLYVPIPGLTAQPADASQPEEPETETPASPGPSPDPAAAEELAKKEADLAAREEALKQKEAEVAKLLSDLGSPESQSAALRRAASLYNNMAPYKAAPLMAQLDDATVLQILRMMTDADAAAILSHMDADRGARIMQELTKPPVVTPAGG